jgi:hypothetical protein
MEFGNRERFAIMVCLEEKVDRHLFLGYFGYWIAGNKVGNHEEITLLSDILNASTWIRYDNKHGRPGIFFSNMPDQKIFDLIESAVYGTSGPDANSLPEDAAPAKFNICPQVDVLIGWEIFMFELPDASKILFKKDVEDNIKHAALKHGEFEEVFEQAYDYLINLESTCRPAN